MSTLTAVLWPETSPLAPRRLPWTPTQSYVPDTVPDTPESVPEREATRLAPTPVPPTPDSPRVQEEARPDRSAATPLFVPASPLVVADTPAAVHQQELTVAPRSAQPARRLFAEPYVSPAELKFREIVLKQQQSFDTRAPLQTYTPHARHRAAAPRPPLVPVQDEVVQGNLVVRHVAGRGQCVFAARDIPINTFVAFWATEAVTASAERADAIDDAGPMGGTSVHYNGLCYTICDLSDANMTFKVNSSLDIDGNEESPANCFLAVLQDSYTTVVNLDDDCGPLVTVPVLGLVTKTLIREGTELLFTYTWTPPTKENAITAQ